MVYSSASGVRALSMELHSARTMRTAAKALPLAQEVPAAAIRIMYGQTARLALTIGHQDCAMAFGTPCLPAVTVTAVRTWPFLCAVYSSPHVPSIGRSVFHLLP